MMYLVPDDIPHDPMALPREPNNKAGKKGLLRPPGGTKGASGKRGSNASIGSNVAMPQSEEVRKNI